MNRQHNQHGARDGLSRFSLLIKDTVPFEFSHQPMDAAERQISLEDMAHGPGVFPIDDELPVLNLVAERHHAAHPQPFLFGSGDFVTDALTRDLALELCKRQQHVQRQSAHGRAGIERLADRDHGNIVRIEPVDQFCEVAQGSCQPINPVDDDLVHLVLFDVLEQLPQCRTRQRATGDTAVVVVRGQGDPAFGFLTVDMRFTQLPLCRQRIERLRQPFFGRLSGIDGAANRHEAPKKRGPDQRVPVMRIATAVRLV